MWAAVIGGVVFLVVHALLAARQRKSTADSQQSTVTAGGVPARIVRHGVGSRFFHWTMAASMFALLITAFVPVIGYKFDWVTIHWIAGLALIATVIYHIVHALVWQKFSNIWVGVTDVREGTRELGSFVGRGAPPDRKPGKYPVAQKLFHHAATLATVAAIATGVLMMFRIDTPIFAQNQYLLSDGSWGFVYVLHGVGGVSLIGLVIAHVYFAIRPDKRWLTRSMFKGWITRDEYLAHHDPERWAVGSEQETADRDEAVLLPR
jgi:cytochrome b subunit of formate dehydrogenase